MYIYKFEGVFGFIELTKEQQESPNIKASDLAKLILENEKKAKNVSLLMSCNGKMCGVSSIVQPGVLVHTVTVPESETGKCQ